MFWSCVLLLSCVVMTTRNTHTSPGGCVTDWIHRGSVSFRLHEAAAADSHVHPHVRSRRHVLDASTSQSSRSCCVPQSLDSSCELWEWRQMRTGSVRAWRHFNITQIHIVSWERHTHPSKRTTQIGSNTKLSGLRFFCRWARCTFYNKPVQTAFCEDRSLNTRLWINNLFILMYNNMSFWYY